MSARLAPVASFSTTLKSGAWSVVLAVALVACDPNPLDLPSLNRGALAGDLRVVDGDTFYLLDRRVRLWGVDAPERGQRCHREATLALHTLVKGATQRHLSCTKKATDRYGRSVEECRVRGYDLGMSLTLAGWTVDAPRYSGGAYAGAEALARRDRRGRWGENCKEDQ